MDPKLYPKDISEAVTLVANSKLGRGVLTALECDDTFSRNRYNAIGPGLVRTLGLLNRAHAIRIGYGRLEESFGMAFEGCAGNPTHILFSQGFNTNRDILGLSALLVHEAVHVHCLETHLLDEEIIAWGAQSAYIMELAYGMSMSDGSRVTGDDIRYEAYRRQCTVKAIYARDDRQNIIDYIVWMDRYATGLTPDWIRRTKDYWGGLGNRAPNTLGRYLNVLIHSANTRAMPIDVKILLITEIIEAMPGNRRNFEFTGRPPSHVSSSTGIDMMLNEIGNPRFRLRGFSRGKAALLDFLERHNDVVSDSIRDRFRAVRIERRGGRWTMAN